MAGDDDEIQEHGRRIRKIANEAESLREAQLARADHLDALAAEVEALAAQLNLEVEAARSGPEERPSRAVLPTDLAAAVGVLPAEVIEQLDDEYLRSVPAISPLDGLDRFMVVCVGCLAGLADFLLVGMPPKTKWTPSDEGGILDTGWLSERLKRWEIGNDNWLARLCTVPFDKPTLPGTDAGFSPVNHRVLSFGHDPSPIGFVFGLMDIASGRMTGVTIDGSPFSIPTVPASWTRVALAPIIWIGHLISDVATPMGIPVPGSGLFQMLRVPVPGAPGNATLNEVARVAYQQGYDFRHYLSGAIVPGLVEGLIRLYDWLKNWGEKEPERGLVRANQAPRYIARARSRARLNALLFYTHAIAAGANAGRIAVQGATGGFFPAVKAVNLAQWQLFTVRSIQFVYSALRDTDLEHAVANRKRIDERWALLTSDYGSSSLLYTRTDNEDSGRIVL